jgi:hypothetical protein
LGVWGNGAVYASLWFLTNSRSTRAAVITEAIGDGWVTDLAQLEKLKPLSSDRTIAEYAKDIWNAEPWLTE